MKKPDPVFVLPVCQHVGQPRIPAPVPKIERRANQNLISARKSRGLFNETPCRHPQDGLLMRKEKFNQFFVIIKKDRNTLEQMGLPNPRQKLVRISHDLDSSRSRPPFHIRYKRSSREEWSNSGASRGCYIGVWVEDRNLYPSRPDGFHGNAGCDRSGRAWLPGSSRNEHGPLVARERSPPRGKDQNSTCGRGNNFWILPAFVCVGVKDRARVSRSGTEC